MMLRGHWSLSTAPTVEPVTTTQCKEQALVDTAYTAQDDWFTLAITAARQDVEEYLQRSLLEQTWELWLDSIAYDRLAALIGVSSFEGDDVIELPRGPVSAVTSIVSYNDANTAATFSSDAYELDADSMPPRVYLNQGYSWPTALRSRNGLCVTYTAGYGSSASDVPSTIRAAITRLVAHRYEHRESLDMPTPIMRMLHPYRVLSL